MQTVGLSNVESVVFTILAENGALGRNFKRYILNAISVASSAKIVDYGRPSSSRRVVHSTNLEASSGSKAK